MLRVSSKVKLSAVAATPTLTPAALALVTLGTGLVLVTYVTPMATVADTLVDLQGGGAARAWVMSSMSIGLAATLLATGAVGDRIGRRRTLVGGLVVLGLGAVACAFADGTGLFVAARILQGIGGAAVLACGLAVLAAATTPGHDRARASAAWGASIGVGISAGVVLAGLFGSEHWRASYVVTAVLALVLAPASHYGLRESSAVDPAPGRRTRGGAAVARPGRLGRCRHRGADRRDTPDGRADGRDHCSRPSGSRSSSARSRNPSSSPRS